VVDATDRDLSLAEALPASMMRAGSIPYAAKLEISSDHDRLDRERQIANALLKRSGRWLQETIH